MADTALRLATLDEFLAFDGEGDARHQLVRGVITAMAPAREGHGEMVIALGSEIRRQLKPPCRVLSEAGVKPAHRDDTYWQADLVVTCAPRDRGRVYQTDPRLVVEVADLGLEVALDPLYSGLLNGE